MTNSEAARAEEHIFISTVPLKNIITASYNGVYEGEKITYLSLSLISCINEGHYERAYSPVPMEG